MSDYRGKTAWLSTKHEKLSLIAPAMQETLGLEVKAVEIDTDQLGTFSPEIPRIHSPLQTAIAKAKLGLEKTGGTLGLASEGSIGPDPQNPFLISDIEIVVLVDTENDLVIHELHRSFEIVAGSMEVSSEQDLEDFLETADFPSHGLIARVKDNPSQSAIKGIRDLSQLQQAISELSKASEAGKVLLESDFRAHQSPSRQKNIELTAKKLAQRLSQNCAKCQDPGFGAVRFRTGLKCQGCGMLDENAIAQELLCCVSCEHQEPGRVIAKELEPERCNWCNP